jgi:hypothetical protein
MRSVSVLACVLGSLMVLVVSANAATVHRHRPRPHVTVHSSQGVTTTPSAPADTSRFAVPGWSNEDTRRWLDNASALAGVGGG